jgi:hypothetical protein
MAQQFCVVDGRASTRSSWNKQITIGATTYVACDFHSDSAMKDAASMIAGGTANSVSPSSPVPSSRNHSKNVHDMGG